MLKTFFLFLVLAVSLVSCADNQNETQIPHPERQCSTTVDWQELIPGQSTTKDVIRILGNPSKKGRIKFEDKRISYYAYDVDGGVIADYAQNRIFFTKDGVIDWMEIIEADSTDRVETVFDVVSLLGNELDVVFSNNNYRPGGIYYDVFDGPTNIYVWSECGVALEALPLMRLLTLEQLRRDVRKVTCLLRCATFLFGTGIRPLMMLIHTMT